jgi:FkbM family methyltransferase
MLAGLATLLRLYMAGPEHPAKYRLVRWLGRRLMPDRGIVGDVYPHAKLWLNPGDWIEYLLLSGVPYEPLTLDFLAANLRSGDTAIFAGVNNGLHAIVAARAVGASGRVIGCEPQPAALLRARANMALNEVPAGSLVLVAAALGNVPALTPLPWAPPDNRGAASFFAAGSGFVAPVFELAQVARALGVQRVRLMLLEVQGCEEQALAGFGDLLRPEIAIVADDPEFAATVGVARAAVYERLRGMGYLLHDVHGEPVDAPGPVLPERNLIAVMPGAAVRWAERPAAAARRQRLAETLRAVTWLRQAR